MKATWLDWIAVGLAVAGAAAWLGFRIRRGLRRQKEAKRASAGCPATCTDCPLSRNCGERRP